MKDKLNKRIYILSDCLKVWGVLMFLSFFSLSSAFGQTVITGKITNQKQEALADVSVMLMQSSDSTIVSFAVSNTSGHYELAYHGDEPRLLVFISALDLKPVVKPIENRTQEVNFVTERGSIEIQEVIVKARKAWLEKDTINYLVGAFMDEKDIVIGDVLKKIPGIKVAESGEISYNGKSINKFYIENLDLLQGRYSLATNNIPAGDISTVQVLENHQPIKALEKTNYSDQAAINLKIKDNKKGVFSLMSLLGIGIDASKDVLWQEELTGMYFGKKRQHLFTYKTNNSGSDVIKELRSYNPNTQIEELRLTDVQQPSPPSIRFERYNFNQTQAFTANNLFKLENEAEVNANIIYYHNKDRSSSFSRTSYLLPGDSSRIIREDILARNTRHRIEGEFRHNLNKDGIYINNYLHVQGGWDDRSGEVNTGNLVMQQLDNKNLSINQVTHWIKRNEGGKGVEIRSNNVYCMEPTHLTITPGLYSNRLNLGEDYSALTQNVDRNVLMSNNRFSFLSALVFKNIQFSPSANVSIEHQTLKSGMDITDTDWFLHPVADIEMQNNMLWTRMDAGGSIEVLHKGQKLKYSTELPFSYRYTVINERHNSEKGKETTGKLYFQPRFNVEYSINHQFSIRANGGLYTQTPDLSTLYTGYILQNYRNINRYDTQSFDSKHLGTSFQLSYKNVLSLLFARIGLSYSQKQREGLYSETLDGLLTVTQVALQPNEENAYTINGHASKGFDWKSLVFSTDASSGKSISEQMRQNQFLDYENRWIRANANVNIQPFPRLTTEYKLSWGYSQGKTSTGEEFPSIRSLTHLLKVNASLPFNINIKGTYEHYYNSALQGNKNFSLADIGLEYTYKKMRFSLDWTNILNTEKYLSAYYHPLNTYYSEYDIRPMSIMLTARLKLK